MGRALWLAGAETRGSLCVGDDSGPMITACAYLGSVNRREREAEEVKKGKIVAGQRGAVGWEGKVPDLPIPLPPHPSWQAHDSQCFSCPPRPGLGPDGEVTAVATSVVSPLPAVRPYSAASLRMALNPRDKGLQTETAQRPRWKRTDRKNHRPTRLTERREHNRGKEGWTHTGQVNDRPGPEGETVSCSGARDQPDPKLGTGVDLAGSSYKGPCWPWARGGSLCCGERGQGTE